MAIPFSFIASQALVFATNVVVTRELGPTARGVYALMLSANSFLTLFMTGGVDRLVPSLSQELNRERLFRTLCKVSTKFTIVFGGCFLFINSALLPNLPTSKASLEITGLSIFSGLALVCLSVKLSFNSGLSYAFSRTSLFLITSVSTVVALLIGVKDPSRLVLAQALGNAIFLLLNIRPSAVRVPSVQSLFGASDNVALLCLHALPYSLLMIARDNVDRFVIAGGFGVKELGYYTAGQAFGVISVVVANALNATSAAHFARGRLTMRHIATHLGLLLGFMVICALGLYAFGPTVVQFVYGENFAPVARLSPIMFVSTSFACARGIVTAIMLLSGQRAMSTIIEAFFTGGSLLLLAVGSSRFALHETLIFVATWNAFSVIMAFLLFRSVVVIPTPKAGNNTQIG